MVWVSSAQGRNLGFNMRAKYLLGLIWGSLNGTQKMFAMRCRIWENSMRLFVSTEPDPSSQVEEVSVFFL
jgi:hypothetical protein